VTPFIRVWLAGAVVLIVFGAVGLVERWPLDVVVTWMLVSVAWAVVAYLGINR